MIGDAELAAWYGHGLHHEKASRLIDEVRELRRLLNERELMWESRWEHAMFGRDKAENKLRAIRELCGNPTFRWNNPSCDRILDLLDGTSE